MEYVKKLRPGEDRRRTPSGVYLGDYVRDMSSGRCGFVKDLNDAPMAVVGRPTGDFRVHYGELKVLVPTKDRKKYLGGMK